MGLNINIQLYIYPYNHPSYFILYFSLSLSSILFLVLLFGSVNAISLLTLIPILLNVVAPLNESRPYEIPFPVELFFDTTKYFYVSFFLICFLLNIMGCVSIGLYSLVLMIVQHCNGLFELVG